MLLVLAMAVPVLAGSDCVVKPATTFTIRSDANARHSSEYS